MDVFTIRDSLVEDYRSFTTSFVDPRDERIRDHLREREATGTHWPDPWLSLNPFFASGGRSRNASTKASSPRVASRSSASRNRSKTRVNANSSSTSTGAMRSRRLIPDPLTYGRSARVRVNHWPTSSPSSIGCCGNARRIPALTRQWKRSSSTR